MKIKGDKIREGQILSKGRLYRVTSCQTIEFEEKDTNDIVNIIFLLQDEQYGVYGNEYKPPFVEDNGGKKADILVLVIDEEKQRFNSWIFDVKKTIGGEDVICHLVEQLAESIQHKKSLTTYFENYEEEEHVGYITQEIQKDRIQETILHKSSYVREEKEKIEKLPALIRNTAKLKLLKEELDK